MPARPVRTGAAPEAPLARRPRERPELAARGRGQRGFTFQSAALGRAMPYLIERKGNVVNVSSVTGIRAFPGILAYCSSKAALDQLTHCVALEVASKGVRVNAVNPGVVVTHLHRTGGMNEQAYAGFLEHSKETHPLGRVGTPDQVADLIYFLASPQASWITGGSYSIDGGRHQTCAR